MVNVHETGQFRHSQSETPLLVLQESDERCRDGVAASLFHAHSLHGAVRHVKAEQLERLDPADRRLVSEAIDEVLRLAPERRREAISWIVASLQAARRVFG